MNTEQKLAKITKIAGQVQPDQVGRVDYLAEEVLEVVGIPNKDKTTQGIVILTIFVFLIGLFAGLAINQNGWNPPAVNCNNLSANDGPSYPERDITAYEWDTYCVGAK